MDDSPTNREIMVRNNIFAFGNEGGARIPENYIRRVNNIPGQAATYLHNIFINLPGRATYAAEVGPVKQHPHNDIFFSDLNLIWDVHARVGYEQGAQVLDPSYPPDSARDVVG